MRLLYDRYEFRQQVRRLASHPSIVVWDGCNECQVIMDTPTGVYATFVMTGSNRAASHTNRAASFTNHAASHTNHALTIHQPRTNHAATTHHSRSITHQPRTSFATMAVVAEEDTSRAVWPSCPAFGWVSGVHSLDATPNGNTLTTPTHTHTARWPYIEYHGPCTASQTRTPPSLKPTSLASRRLRPHVHTASIQYQPACGVTHICQPSDGETACCEPTC